jgi:hypothetical protein
MEDGRQRNVFSEPWSDSDLVLVVEKNEFHVHRSMLSLQSPVFKAMFYGNFKDSQQDRIELKDDKYEAVLLFLKLLYPRNMLDEDVDIDDENILLILEVADKYTAKNVIKQCMEKIDDIEAETTMSVLPYAARHEFPLEKIFDVISRHISTEQLDDFAPEIGDQTVYINALRDKCRFQENIARQAHTTMLHLLKRIVAASEGDKSKNITFYCSRNHSLSSIQNFKKARECRNCFKVYRKRFIEAYAYPSTFDFDPRGYEMDIAGFIDLLERTDDIATSLES